MRIGSQCREDWCHGCGERTTPFVIVTISHDAENKVVDPVREFRLCTGCVAMIAHVSQGLTVRVGNQ